ncbi:MAG: PKD domain-containing protein, partial [Bacteroidales bacterium]|nr:PKD domain-containing protein [Bacteroidales bacterium]
AWWFYVGWLYATPTQAASPSGYFDGEGGVTEGGDWYVTHGGRQDYMNYFKHCREATIEWSDTKLIDVNQLPLHWDYNIEGMLAYTEQVLYGLRGIVSDACTGSALSNVKVEIIGHDKDNSEVYSSAPIGNYHRPIYEGTYDFTFSLDGYQSQTHTVTITNYVSTRLDIQLVPNSVAAPDFSASGVNVSIGTDVSFTDLSSGTVSTYSWVFEGGDPAISSDANPIINYANDGVYNVSLEIESAGCTITELKEDYITVYIPGAPVADFVADVTETCTGIVQFTNSSVDAVSYEWDFGDGSSLSSEANPTHIYDQSGVFTVSLTATNTYGSNTKTYTDYITVNLPAAPITVGAQSCGPATLSLSASGESTLQWYDANVDGNLIHTGNNMEDYFTNTTTYYVQSGISPSYFLGGNSDIDVNGGNHTSNAYYLIFNAHEDFRLVSVDVNASSAGNRIIQLRNSSDVVIESKTVNLSTGINTVELNFDISAGTNYQLKCGTSTPNLWRNNSGTSWPYNISDVVSITGTNAGNTDYYYYFYNWEIFYGDECISSRTPVTAEIIETPNADAPENVTACDSYYLPALTNGEYYLSSNGVDPIAVGTEITSSQTIYVYAESGTTPNCTNENSFNITINETPLVDNPVDITVCDSYVLPTLTNGEYFLSPNGVDPIAEGTEITSSQTIYVYAETGTTPNCFAETSFTVTINNATQVDIGDNIIGDCDATVMLDAGADYSSYEWNGTLGSQTLEVTTTGTYTIVVEDANGCTSTDDVNVEIRENPVAEVITTLESSPGANDATASVNVISGEPPFNYMWFNSNQTHEVSGLTNGIYCVTVTSSNACSVETCGTVNTNGAPPMANFVANQTFGCDNLTVNFTDESSNNPTSWFWEFGDGSSTSSEVNPIHTYSVPGIYNVSLTVTNAEGSNSVTYESYITIGETPTLELSMTEETVLGNDGTASVIITGGAEPYEILWTGGLDTETIVGLNAGEYCVTVTGDNTCQAYDCIIVSLEDVIPSVVDFVASQTEACGSLTVQFTDLSYYEATSWAWDFGDGGTSNDQNPEHFYASPGSYTVSLSIESEFGQDELEVPSYITVFEKPVIEFDITHESGAGNADGQIEMIITGGEAPYTINWSNNEHSLLISGLSAGLYSAAIIDDNGCLGSGIAEVNVITSISDEAKNKLQIYPNPTDGEFTIISDKIINKVAIIDALGRVCVSQKSNTNKIIIDSNLRQGVYQVKVITENGEFVKKLVVR